MDRSIIASLVLILPFAPVRSQDVGDSLETRIEGIVRDVRGKPVSYAFVSLAGGARSTVTNVDGKFVVIVKHTGSRIPISARRIGYTPIDTSLMLGGIKPSRVSLTMRTIATKLDTVQIRASVAGYDEYLDRSGFYRRMTRKIDGTYFGREEIERKNVSNISSILNNVPGIHVMTNGGKGRQGTYVLGRGRSCPLGLVIDGQFFQPASPPLIQTQPRIRGIYQGREQSDETQTRGPKPVPLSIDEIAPLNMLAGIEVYPSAASVPNDLRHYVNECGLIVAWTRYK